MELNTELLTDAARPSASIVLLRDGPRGLEVFLLKRHGASDVLANAYVFAGGKVDLADAAPGLHALLDQAPQAMAAQLGEPDLDTATAASLFVAAVRELFEESGVLLAEDASPETVAAATALLDAGHAFEEVLQRFDLRLRTRGLAPWSRWITPRLASVTRRRFDTRFFLSAVPAGQTARHDNREATDSVWLAPADALRAYWEGTLELAPPQIMGLAHLARHRSLEEAMAAARLRLPPLIEPEAFQEADVRMICYPGDRQHSRSERALPGPTRLYYRNRRFEPEGGLGLLLGDLPDTLEADDAATGAALGAAAQA